MIYFFLDSPKPSNVEKGYFEEDNSFYNVLYPTQRCLGLKSIVKECWSVLRTTKNHDTIMCWYDFTGVVLWWLCIFTFQKRKIVIINLLLKNKNTLKNKLARVLYKFALQSKSTVSTVTSTRYGLWINDFLKIHKGHVLLRDIYYGEVRPGNNSVIEDNTYLSSENIKVTENSVFCGGRNGRDWPFLFDIAKRMPDVIFKCVMPLFVYNKYKTNLGNNVQCFCDVSYNEFEKVLQKSKMLVMPLDTEAPAGLIVMFQAANLNKLVITSDTIVTQEYLSENQGVLIDKNIEKWVSRIHYYLDNSEKADTIAQNFKTFLSHECSKSTFISVLKRTVDNFDEYSCRQG